MIFFCSDLHVQNLASVGTKKVMLETTGGILTIAMPLIHMHSEFGIMLVIPMFTVLISPEVTINFSPTAGSVLTTVQVVNAVMIPASVEFYMSAKLKR